VYLATRMVRTIYPMPETLGQNGGGGGGGSGTMGSWMLYSWPATVSLIIAKQTDINNVVVVGIYTLGSLLLMNSRTGSTPLSSSPIIQGMDETLGSTIRQSPIWNQKLPIVRALPGFLLCQFLEIGSAITTIGAFFQTTERFATTPTPHHSGTNDDDDTTYHPTWYHSRYKYLGLTYTTIRGLIATIVMYSFVFRLSPVVAQLLQIAPSVTAAASAAATTTDIDVLNGVMNKISIELLFVNALGVLYICLSAAQICDRLVRKLLPMTSYSLPVAAFAMKVLLDFISTYAQIFNMKAIYLKFCH